MADIRGVELLVIAERKADDKGRSWKLRLVQWVVDGKSKSVKLEKRNFFTDEYGAVKTGKAEGFKIDDIRALKPHWTDIIEKMEHPPAVQEEAGQSDSQEPEAAPF